MRTQEYEPRSFWKKVFDRHHDNTDGPLMLIFSFLALVFLCCAGYSGFVMISVVELPDNVVAVILSGTLGCLLSAGLFAWASLQMVEMIDKSD